MDKLDRVIPVRFSEEQWKQIKTRAQEQGRTASDLVRWVVMEYLRADDRHQIAVLDSSDDGL